MQATHILSPDTQAILLLCGTFGSPRDATARPLTLAEYNRLVQWLQRHDLRPADLLQPDIVGRFTSADLPIDAQRLLALLERGGAMALAVEGWANRGLWVVSRSDDRYPQRLKGRLGRQAPAILYGVGDVALLAGGGLAIVGSRDVDDAALDYARSVAATCARQGIQVVSGGARGVDTEAMLAALEHGGTAVGVLADSLARAAVSGRYRAGLLEGRLALVSPYDPASGFHVGNAMGRNKYIYALADWGVAISASEGTGGTWAGAIEALKHERPLFVRVEAGAPLGNRALLARGARPFPSEPWVDLADTLCQAAEVAPAATATQGRLIHEQPEQYVSAQPDAGPHLPADSNGSSGRQAPVTPAPPGADGIEAAGLVGRDHPPQPDSVFAAVLPLVYAHLDQPRDARTLATLLDVRLIQLKDWLDRAVAEGKLVKRGKPARYAVKQRAAPLFPVDSFN